AAPVPSPSPCPSPSVSAKQTETERETGTGSAGRTTTVRNAEVIRQWRILKRIEAGRYTTAQDLADEHGVTERTIRRDIEALQEAGFPLFDERTDGRKVWRPVERYQQRLTQTFTLA